MNHCFNPQASQVSQVSQVPCAPRGYPYPVPSACAASARGTMAVEQTILVVDVSASLRRLVGIVLRNSGYNVIEAAGVAQALEQLDGRDIVMAICELRLSGQSAIELAKLVHAYPTYQSMPILILAAPTDVGLKEQARAAGARAWMVKPFIPTKLLSAIHTLCAEVTPMAA